MDNGPSLPRDLRCPLSITSVRRNPRHALGYLLGYCRGDDLKVKEFQRLAAGNWWSRGESNP